MATRESFKLCAAKAELRISKAEDPQFVAHRELLSTISAI